MDPCVFDIDFFYQTPTRTSTARFLVPVCGAGHQCAFALLLAVQGCRCLGMGKPPLTRDRWVSVRHLGLICKDRLPQLPEGKH